MVVRTKPASKVAPRATRTAAPAKKAAPARKAAAPARKAAASAPAPRAAKAAPKAAAPRKASAKDVPSAHDVLRALRTYEKLRDTYFEAYSQEVDEAADFVAPVSSPRRGRPEVDGPARKVKVAAKDQVNEEFYDRDKTEALPVPKLRELAVDLADRGVITEVKIKSVILEQMEDAGLFRDEGDVDSDAADEDEEFEDEDSEESEDDESDDDEDESDDDDEELDEEEYTRADLKKMDLKELQELAEINEIKWKGLNQKDLIDAMLGEDDEDDEEDGEEDEDDEEVFEIDPSELPKLSLEDLLDICKQAGFKVPVAKRKDKKAVIELILANLDEDE